MMSSVGCAEETKFIYYIDEEETPYLVKLSIPPDVVTLGDFKNALNRPHFKFFFKSLDDDFGVVKEEIFDDNAVLPCFNGRVVSWLVTTDSSTISDSGTTEPKDEAFHRNKITIGGPDSTGHGLRDDAHSTTKPAQHNHTTAAPADSTSASLSTCGNALQSADPDNESVHSAGQDRIAPLRSFHNYKSGGRLHLSRGTAPCGHHNGHYGSTGGGSGGRHRHHRIYGTCGPPTGNGTYETPQSMLSSDVESTSFFDSEDESSRFSSVTGTTLSSRRYGRVRQRRKRRRPPPISRASSFSSITDSTMSLNIVAVTLNMDTVNFLGISIVGQSNKAGDGGIYVGSIMKGGAVAQDGRIEPGDMILEVNGISFEEMSNDDAVRTLREQVQRPGPITLVVAKCWDPNPCPGYFTVPRQEPVRPIDPRAWVLHTNAMTAAEQQHQQRRGENDPQLLLNGASSGGESSSTLSPSGADGLTPGMSMGTLTSGQTSMPMGTSAAAYNMAILLASQQQQQQQSKNEHLLQQPPHPQLQLQHNPMYPLPSSMIPPGYPQQVTPSVVTASSSLPEIERYSEPIPLTVNTDPATVIGALIQPDSGLDIRDRIWLKLTVPNAFIGSDLVDWLYRHLDGFTDRRSARKYASSLLKSGYIRHTVNKTKFSEQCYYVFPTIAGHMSCLSLEEVDSVSEVGALPAPTWGQNTTSTNLTVGPSTNTSNTPMPDHSVGLTMPNSDFLPTSTAIPHLPPGVANGGALGMVECGGSSQYSSVPSAHYHQPLTAPIRQLIADGQDAAAAAAIPKSTTHRCLRPSNSQANGNKNPGNMRNSYSDSSSSSDSELNHFSRGKPSHEIPVSKNIDPINFLHTSQAVDSTTPLVRHIPHSQVPSNLTRPLTSYATPTCSLAQSLSTAKDVAASSTASSSTSEGNRSKAVTHTTQQPDSTNWNRMQPEMVGQDSSKSSSSSSCCVAVPPRNTSLFDRRGVIPGATQSQAPSVGNMNQRVANHQPPPPPPRISTAAYESPKPTSVASPLIWFVNFRATCFRPAPVCLNFAIAVA
ncbi:hypothetical protein T265_15158 [Opisthorchis viverrini]|uniref:DIX domain protein n=1 Tax=Opisthorchis viverrini TaxID=6198 RepID=A0A074ZD97_OPIVI|nr:hypothetical protein T265_15158 [Opisthorchis viverrini]KER21155.1 hypothetical protein T265_15158 [Opisthorchis viverrini]